MWHLPGRRRDRRGTPRAEALLRHRAVPDEPGPPARAGGLGHSSPNITAIYAAFDTSKDRWSHGSSRRDDRGGVVTAPPQLPRQERATQA